MIWTKQPIKKEITALAAQGSTLNNAVTTLNSNLSKLESADEPSGRAASLSELKSYISSIATGMKTNGALPVTCTIDFTDDTFSTGARVYGTLMRRTDSYFSFIGTDLLGNAISFSNNGGIWTFNKLALNSKITTTATALEMPSEYGSSSTCNVYKAGNVVTVIVNASNISVTLQKWNRISIVNLPVGYNPKTNIRQPVTINTTEGLKQEMLTIYTSGNISITEDLVGTDLTVNDLRFSITFVV